LSITADNPLFSTLSAQIALDDYKKYKPDFIFTKGLPIGCNLYCLKLNALDVANFMKKDSNTEIWGPFVNRSDFFYVHDIILHSHLSERNRLTLDYPEDYNILKLIYCRFDKDYVITFEDVQNIFLENPNLWKINEHCVQRIPSADEIYRIENIFNKNIAIATKYVNNNNLNIIPGYTKNIVDII